MTSIERVNQTVNKNAKNTSGGTDRLAGGGTTGGFTSREDENKVPGLLSGEAAFWGTEFKVDARDFGKSAIGKRIGAKNRTIFTRSTAGKYLRDFSALSPAEITAMQKRLYAAHLYPDDYYSSVTPTGTPTSPTRRVKFGTPDMDTLKALQSGIDYAVRTKKSLQHVLSSQAEQYAEEDALNGGMAEPRDVGGGQFHVINTSNPAAVGELVDDIATKLTGSRLDGKKRQSIVQDIINKEISTQRATNNASDSVEMQNFNAEQVAKGAVTGDQSSSGIDQLMSAIAAKESGGNYNITNKDSGAAGKYQIMPKNWPAWSKEAGLGANAPRTPQNQETVARFKMQQYLNQFGSPEAVAVAWYAGPGAAKEYLKNPNAAKFTKKQGKYPSIRDYARSISSKLGGGTGATGKGPGGNKDADVWGNELASQFGLRVSSGYRSPAENKKAGGASKSDHMSDLARDLAGTPKQMKALADWAKKNTGPGKLFRYVEYGTPDHKDHVHLSFNADKVPPGAKGRAAGVKSQSSGSFGADVPEGGMYLPSTTVTQQAVDVDAEARAAIKAQNPLKYQATQFANYYDLFMNMGKGAPTANG